MVGASDDAERCHRIGGGTATCGSTRAHTDERVSRIEEKDVGSPSRGGAIGDDIPIRLARADFHQAEPGDMVMRIL
jgi:hypothetical protein